MGVWQIPLVTCVALALSTLFGDALLGLARLRARALLLRLAAGGAAGLLIALLVWTGVHSVGWSSAFGVSIALAVAALRARRPPHPVTPASRGPWLGAVAVASLSAGAYALWLAWFLTDGGAELVRPPLQRDSAHYVVLTAFLARFGFETPHPHFLDGVALLRSPYHYLDAWLGAAVSRLSGVGPVLAYMAVAQSLLATLVVAAAAALIRRLTRAPPTLSIGCALAGLLPGFEPAARLLSTATRGTGLGLFVADIESYVMSPLLVSKMLPAALILTFALLAWAHGRSRPAAPWILAALPLAYVTFAPFALSALGLVVLLQLRKRAFREAAATAAAIVLSIALLALELGGKPSSEGSLFLRREAHGLPELLELIGSAARIAAGASSRLAVLVALPVVVILLSLRGSVRRRWLAWLALPSIFGLLLSIGAWAAVYRLTDSWQLLTTASSCFFALAYGVALALAARWAARGWKVRALARPALSTALTVALIASAGAWAWWQLRTLADAADAHVSAGFREGARRKLQALSSQKEQGFGVWIRNGNNLRALWDFYLGVATHGLAFMITEEPYTVAVPWGRMVLAEGLDGERQRSAVSHSPFFRASRLPPEEPVEDRHVDTFLTGRPIRYAVLDPGVTPGPCLSRHLEECHADPATGLRFCLWRAKDGDCDALSGAGP